MSAGVHDAPYGRWRAVLAAILLGAGALRAWLALDSPLIYDEYRWLAVADRVSLVPLSLPLHGDQHPPLAAWLAAAGSALLGPNLLGYRLAALVLGVALVGLAWRLASRLAGEPAGCLAAALVAGNEYLVGVSRLATEKCYLAFGLAAVLLYLRAVESGRIRDYAAAGALFGAGLLTKETLLLWLAPLAWLTLRRPGAGRGSGRGPILALALALAGLVPDLAWNLLASWDPSHSSEAALAWQLGRLRLGPSVAPLALYLRPLQYPFVEPEVSEYASMTALPGLLLLLGLAASVALLRSREARLVQALALVPLAAFSLVWATTRAEFWWADLSVVPAAVLTAGGWARMPRGRGPLAAAVLGVTLGGAVGLAGTDGNCHAATWPRVPAAALQRCEEGQRALVVRFRDRDHDVLTRLGPWRLPAAREYVAALKHYLARLDGGQAGTSPSPWPAVPAQRRAAERRWAQAEIDRLSGP